MNGDTSHTPVRAFPCRLCGAQGVWVPERRALACASCGTPFDLPAAPAGSVPGFSLVGRLRDAPENVRSWAPTSVRLPCPTCAGPVVFPAAVTGMSCAACGTPLLRGPHEGDAPLAPDGVIPFAIGEAAARDQLRTWFDRKGSRFRGVPLEIDSLRRIYMPYWRFSAHVHCPYRGSYQRTTRSGDTREVVYDGVIDGDFEDRERGFSSLPAHLVTSLEPLPLDGAVPYDPRYLAGAVVEDYAVSPWGAWDAVRARIDERIDRRLRKAGDGSTMPTETWPTWSNQRGWLVLAPIYAGTCRARLESWPALVDGVTGSVAGTLPVTGAERIKGHVTALLGVAVLVGAAGVVLWLLWTLLRLAFGFGL